MGKDELEPRSLKSWVKALTFAYILLVPITTKIWNSSDHATAMNPARYLKWKSILAVQL